jgi:nucleoside phosphorylase
MSGPSNAPPRILCLAAWEPELTRFRELAPGGIAVEAAGIGLVDAAIGTAELVARRSPERVLFVGTCGAMRPDLRIGDVVFAERVSLVAFEELTGSAVLHPVEHEVALDPELREALLRAGAKPARVANTIGVTSTEPTAARVAVHGDVEHLEAFGVVRACARANVPCAVVLAVANEVGPRGRDQWKANHVAASARAAEVAWRAIEPFSRTSTRAPSRA